MSEHFTELGLSNFENQDKAAPEDKNDSKTGSGTVGRIARKVVLAAAIGAGLGGGGEAVAAQVPGHESTPTHEHSKAERDYANPVDYCNFLIEKWDLSGEVKAVPGASFGSNDPESIWVVLPGENDPILHHRRIDSDHKTFSEAELKAKVNKAIIELQAFKK